MRKVKYHTLSFDTDGKNPTGAGVKNIKLDGQPLKGVTGITIKLKSRAVNSISIELIGIVKGSVLGSLGQKVAVASFDKPRKGNKIIKEKK
jgi:hypothetical protein